MDQSKASPRNQSCSLGKGILQLLTLLKLYPNSTHLLLYRSQASLDQEDLFFQAKRKISVNKVQVCKKHDSWRTIKNKWILTAMYAAHPALLVFALLSTKRPEIPKSQSLTPPTSSKRILLGLTSLWITPCFSFRYDNAFTV